MAQGERDRVRMIRSALTPDAALALAMGVRSEQWRAAARALKRDARVIVRAGDMPGTGAGGAFRARIVVKTWRLTRVKDLLNIALGRTQGLRHWRGAMLLTRLGVATAAPLALFRVGREETLVMREVPGKSLLAHLDEWERGVGDLRAGEAGAIARAVGAQVRRLADAGWFNRDNKPSNLIVIDHGAPGTAPGTAPGAAPGTAPGTAPGVRPGTGTGTHAGGRFEIALIDVVGIRRDRLRVGGLRMLVSLMLEPMGVGRAPRRAMRMRTLKEASGGAPLAARKSAWRAVEQAIDEHGDPTPRINPLDAPG